MTLDGLADFINLLRLRPVTRNNTHTKENTTMSTPHSDLRTLVEGEAQSLHTRIGNLRDIFDRRLTALETTVGEVDASLLERRVTLLERAFGDPDMNLLDRLNAFDRRITALETPHHLLDRLNGIDKAVGALWSQHEDEERTIMALTKRVADVERIMGYAVIDDDKPRDEAEPGTDLFDRLVDTYCQAVMSFVSPDSDEHSVTPAVNLFADVTGEDPRDVATAIAETLTSAGFQPRITWDGEPKPKAKSTAAQKVPLVAEVTLAHDDYSLGNIFCPPTNGRCFSCGAFEYTTPGYLVRETDGREWWTSGTTIHHGEGCPAVDDESDNIDRWMGDPDANGTMTPVFSVGSRVVHKAATEWVGTIIDLNVPVPSGEHYIRVRWDDALDTRAITDVPAENLELA